MKPPKKTRAELLRQITELHGQLASAYHFASLELPKAENLMGSGVLIQMHALGGRQLITPVVIRDGLSPETIEAIQKDLARSFELATQFKPKGLTP